LRSSMPWDISAQPWSIAAVSDHHRVVPSQPMWIIGVRSVCRELGRGGVRHLSHCCCRRCRLARAGSARIRLRGQHPWQRGGFLLEGAASRRRRRQGCLALGGVGRLLRRLGRGAGVAANSMQRRASDGLREMDLHRRRGSTGGCRIGAAAVQKRWLSCSRADGCVSR